MEWFKKLGTQVKIALGAIAAFFGFILFFFVRQQIRAKQKMEYELSRVESELKIAELEEDSKEKVEKIEALKKEEVLIREKIKYIEEKEVEEGREVSLEELDAWFEGRGF